MNTHFCVLTGYLRRRQWQPTPVLLPGKFHGWRSLVGDSPWIHKSQTQLSDFTCFAFLCVSGINLSWSWYTILLRCCWIRVASILLRTFRLCSSVILAYNFLSLWYFFLVFISWWWWHHRINLTVFLPLQFLGRVVWVG